MKKYNEIDLNLIFKGINRISEAHDEGKYYDIIRRSPEPSVITGGQTGVDSLGLQAAGALGLPCYAIMPKGQRKESEEKEFSKIIARTIELQSESYRFRTYANVYFADVTLIWDFCNSEGTKAAMDASIMLDKPYILVNDCGIDDAFNKLKVLNPKIINIAGNRGSNLKEEQARAVFSEIYKVLKRYCGSMSVLCQSENKKSIKSSKTTIGVPNFYQAKEIFKKFLKDCYGLEIVFDKKLFYQFTDFNVILARPRDLIDMLDNGVDLIIVGSDLLEEYNVKNVSTLYTRLIPNATVLVGNKPVKNCKVCCSQYPNIAKKYFDNKGIDLIVKPILGGAEGWLNAGICDIAVDTLQTGDTIFSNEIEYIDKISESCLALVTKKFNENCSLFKAFSTWLSK